MLRPYQTPVLELLEICVEQGFGTSDYKNDDDIIIV